MKKLFVFFSMLAMAAILSMKLTSCGGDDPLPAPTLKINVQVDPDDQYTVKIAVQSTSEPTITWDYGNGKTATNNGDHTFTYEESGKYTITATATNETGTVKDSEEVTINASIQEILAGVEPEGKQWIISSQSQESDGVGPLKPSELAVNMPISLVQGDLLAFVGFSEEYDNVFTFKPDGSFEIDPVNGKILCTQIKAVMETGETSPGNKWQEGKFGFATMAWEVSGAKWKVTQDTTIAFAAMSEDPTSTLETPPLTPMDVELKDVDLLTITNGYFGILDLTNYVTFQSVAADKIQVNIIIHTRDQKPSMFARMTMVPKE